MSYHEGYKAGLAFKARFSPRMIEKRKRDLAIAIINAPDAEIYKGALDALLGKLERPAPDGGML